MTNAYPPRLPCVSPSGVQIIQLTFNSSDTPEEAASDPLSAAFARFGETLAELNGFYDIMLNQMVTSLVDPMQRFVRQDIKEVSSLWLLRCSIHARARTHKCTRTRFPMLPLCFWCVPAWSLTASSFGQVKDMKKIFYKIGNDMDGAFSKYCAVNRNKPDEIEQVSGRASLG